MLAGGVLLLWVCWKMYRELRPPAAAAQVTARPGKSLREAMVQIVLADVSMSLDNVLAVAGAAHDHPWVLAAVVWLVAGAGQDGRQQGSDVWNKTEQMLH